ncbi:MAG: MgtC/SapB family protein [Bacteroidia bacterium]
MEKIFQMLSQTEITTEVSIYRLILSLILGGLIGIDRERSRQAAGLRTHILICTGATLLMLVSAFVPQKFEYEMGDPGRIVAQVVSGIGFLGAGAIFRLGVNVKGLTTAASIWVVAAIGITVGTGLYEAAIFATFLLLFVLVVLNYLEKIIFPHQILKILKIKANSIEFDLIDINIAFRENKIKLGIKNIAQDFEKKETIYTYYIYLTKNTDLQQFINSLSNSAIITQISVEDKEN